MLNIKSGQKLMKKAKEVTEHSAQEIEIYRDTEYQWNNNV